MASGLRFAKRAVEADLARFKAYVEMQDAKALEYGENDKGDDDDDDSDDENEQGNGSSTRLERRQQRQAKSYPKSPSRRGASGAEQEREQAGAGSPGPRGGSSARPTACAASLPLALGLPAGALEAGDEARDDDVADDVGRAFGNEEAPPPSAAASSTIGIRLSCATSHPDATAAVTRRRRRLRPWPCDLSPNPPVDDRLLNAFFAARR